MWGNWIRWVLAWDRNKETKINSWEKIKIAHQVKIRQQCTISNSQKNHYTNNHHIPSPVAITKCHWWTQLLSS